MDLPEWLDSFGLDLSFDILGDDMDEDFQKVYDAYEEFYREANTPNGRTGKRMSAGNEFMNAVMEYYEVDGDEATAGIGMGLFLNADGGYSPNPLEEKMSEEELYQYLEGQI